MKKTVEIWSCDICGKENCSSLAVREIPLLSSSRTWDLCQYCEDASEKLYNLVLVKNYGEDYGYRILKNKHAGEYYLQFAVEGKPAPPHLIRGFYEGPHRISLGSSYGTKEPKKVILFQDSSTAMLYHTVRSRYCSPSKLEQLTDDYRLMKILYDIIDNPEALVKLTDDNLDY